MRKILFIHGRAQGGKDPVALKAEWIAALNQGCDVAGVARPDPAVIAFPFYADRLDHLVATMNAPPARVVARGAGGPADPYLQFQQEIAEEIQEVKGISDQDAEKQLSAAERARGPQNWEWVQAILKAIDEHIPWAANGLVETVTRDAWTYLTAPGIRDDVDQIVNAELTDDETVVVGHSLGSIVGYSVLVRATRPLKVVRYVTLGSPLGIQAIRRRLTPLKYPANTTDWFNAFDERDVVALRPLDAKAFPVKPGVTNKSHVKNRTDNRHGIVGYLDDADVARAIMT